MKYEDPEIREGVGFIEDDFDLNYHQEEQERKMRLADKIFKYIMSVEGRPIWTEKYATQFKFSTANALRHFLRKYSLDYKRYRKGQTELSSQIDGEINRDIDNDNDDNEDTKNSFGREAIEAIIKSRQKNSDDVEDLIRNKKQNPEILINKYITESNNNLGYKNDTIPDFVDLLNPEMQDRFRKYSNTYVYRGQMEPENGLPEFTGPLHLGGNMIIVGDVHIPSTNWEMVDRMIKVAIKHLPRPRTICIVGDILNGDKDSRYEHIIQPMSRQEEFRLTDIFLQACAKVFDNIYLTPGNHLHRLMKKLEGDIGMDDLKRLLTQAHERIEMSHYDSIIVDSGDETWFATHQHEYSRTKLKVANALAQKYHMNIITLHQHHSAIGRDEFNRFTLIDCGGLHQSQLMAYTQLIPNSMPVMNNGFVILRDGTGSLLTPYPSITDWKLWL